MPDKRWTSMIALVALALVTGCTDNADEVPVRVSPLPAEVRGLGPAVFAVPVADDRRDDLTGLLAVERFGDDLAGLTPARRHAEIAVGDPRFPTVAEGLAEDRRDVLLVDGRLRQIALPDNVFVRKATPVGPSLSITASRCLAVTGDGTVTQPTPEAACTAAERGGVVWQDRPGGRYGGIDLTTGAASPAVALPSPPVAASPDGRHLAALTAERPPRLVVADTRTGRSQPTVTLSGRNDVLGVFTDGGGFAVLRRSGTIRTISLVTPDGRVRDLLTPVGEVAFAPHGRHAIVADTRSGAARLAVLDLPSGTVRPVVDGGGRATELPPLTGAVTMTTSGDTALVVDLPGSTVHDRTPRPSRIRSVRLSTATATAHSGAPPAAAVRVGKPVAAPAEAVVVSTVSTLSFQPGGETVSLGPDGTVTVAPPGAVPRAALGDGVVLHHLTDSDGNERADRLLVIDGAGGRTEVATGAGPDQRVEHVILTPDGAHLLVSLRAVPLRQQPRPLDAVVVARRDGTGKPVVVYQGAVLTSLGTVPTTTR